MYYFTHYVWHRLKNESEKLQCHCPLSLCSAFLYSHRRLHRQCKHFIWSPAEQAQTEVNLYDASLTFFLLKLVYPPKKRKGPLYLFQLNWIILSQKQNSISFFGKSAWKLQKAGNIWKAISFSTAHVVWLKAALLANSYKNDKVIWL